MKEALSDVARLRKMGKESYRIVKEEINTEKMVEIFVNALNKVTVTFAKHSRSGAEGAK
jgi:hypothetical protein